MPVLLVRPSALCRLVLAQCLFLLGTAHALSAQLGEGNIQGVARSEEAGSPIPFALVRLLPVTEDTAAPRQVITGDAGHFRFARVPAGEYRLQLLRIGYRPAVSPVLGVQAGESLEHELRVASQALQLPAVTVLAEGSCAGPAQITDGSRLAELWNEARKGVEIRRAFELQYRFVRTFRQDAVIRLRIGGPKSELRVDTLVNEPDSVVAREQRRRERDRREGHGRGNLLAMPDERQLFEDEFLRDHCLDPVIQEAEGVLGLRFHPARSTSQGFRIRGTIWVDANSYLMRRLDVEWLDNVRRIGDAIVDYADIVIGGSTLRLPVGGRAALYRLSGPMGLFARSAAATLTYSYRDFEQVRVGGN